MSHPVINKKIIIKKEMKELIMARRKKDDSGEMTEDSDR
jgi:hypothetical protein